MFKKVLFIVASLGLGLLFILFVDTKLYANLFVEYCTNSINENNYSNVERLFPYVMAKEDDRYTEDKDDIHFEMLGVAFARSYYEYNEEAQAASEKYTTLEETLGLFFFKVNGLLKMEDGENQTGGRVVVTLSDNSEYTIYLNNLTRKDDKNYGNDYYQYAAECNCLFVPLYYSDLEDTSLSVTSVKLISSDEKVVYSGTMNYSLNTKFEQNLASTLKDSTSMKQAIDNYNEAVLENYNAMLDYRNNKITEDEKNTKVSQSEEKAKTASAIIVELSANEEKFYRQVDQTIITTTPKFIWLTILFIVIYLGVDAGVGFLIFRKRQPKARPVPKSIPPRDHVYKYDNKEEKE